MELTSLPSVSKRLLSIMRFIYYMFRKRMTISKQKLVMDLHLLLDRRKVAGKTLYDHLITTTLHRRRSGAFTSTSTGESHPDITKSYVPWDDVDCISCSKGHHQHGVANKCDVGVAIAKALEMLNSEIISDADSMAVSPLVNLRKSPMATRRVTDSPLPVTEEEGEVGSRVDREAEEFIQQFYENLRRQQSAPDSP